MSIKFKIGQALPRLLQFAVFLVAVQVMPAFAKEHPVPLDKNVDSAKCLECHEDKSKGKAVHSAIAMGCLSCHEVRVNKDVTRVKLITTTPASLCLQLPLRTRMPPRLKGMVHQPGRSRLHQVPRSAHQRQQVLSS